MSRAESEKNLRKEELRENETEEEWYKIKNGKIVKERIERRRGRGGNWRGYRGGGRWDLIRVKGKEEEDGDQRKEKKM